VVPAVNGEWTDPGFTEVADYAFFNTGLTRTGYGPGGWIRQAMLVKGEQAGEYDYVMFRDVRPYGTETISSIHLGTRLPSSSWATTASPAVATVTGRHGGRARFRPLDPIAGTFGSTVGITYPLNEQPHCRLREAFSGGNSGRPESPSRLATVNATLATINTTQPGGCMTNGTAAHSSIDFNLTTTAKNATWMLQGGFGGSIDPTVTQLAPGVFKVSNSTGSQRDYVFISDDRIEWSGTDTYQTTSSPVSFKGNAGVIRVRGTQVALSLNAGKGEVKHGLHTLTGEGPRLCRGTVGAANACTAPPSAPYTIPAVSCTPVTVAPRVTVCTNTGTKTTQYRVLNDSTGVPVDYKAPDSSITIDGIVDGAITIAPYHTNFTVLAGSGLFQASGKTIIGGGPFTVDSYPDRIEGNTEGRPRALWVDGLHVPSRLMVDGVNVTNEEIPTIWMTSVGLTGGPQAFEITKLENRLRSMPHLNYTLDRITGRAVATPRQAPPGAMVFSGYGDFSDSARWSPHAPVAGDTVFIPANSGVALLSDTPQLASIIVDGAITVHTSTARLRATDVELCGTLTHAANMATAAVSGAWPIDAKISIEATNFKLCSTGVIDVSGKGYQARVIVAGQGYSSSSGYGPSGGQGGAHGSGAGHGGAGGRNRDWDLIGGAAHDSVQHPIQPGSAGGSNGWDSFGGAGGGVVRIAVTGRATIDGIIAADGLPPAAFVPSNPTHSGGGSGGAVEIVCNELVGSGLIRANGGGPSGEGGGGGAGGRIAVSYVNLPAPMASLRLSAAGGRVASTLVPRGEDGELGTVYLPDARFFPGVNVIDSAELVLGSTAAIQRASLTVRDAALHLPAGVPVRIDGALSVRGSKGVLKLRGDASAASVDIYENSRVELISPAVALPNTNGRYGSALRVAGMLYVRSGATIVPRSDKVTGVSPQIFAQNLEVQTTAAIAADATGFGCCDAMGHGYGPGWGAYNGSGVAFGKGGGGDYGGLGGTATGGLAGGTTYGTSTSPEQPGSAGGTGLDTNWPGGAGGGLAYLSVAGTARIDGLLTANGASSPRRPNNGNLSWAGAGAGGTVYLVCNTFAGSGAIRARGGAPSINGGGGGGGRIAIYRTTSQWLGEAITASGSTSGGSVTPVNGTVPGALGSVSNAFNAAPTITLTPAASTVFFAAPGGTVSIPLAATASDSDGTIARVSFYADNVLISDDLSSPYAFTWSSVAPGTHTLFAVAQDNRGMTVSTTPIPVEVWETSDIGSVGVTGSASYSAGSFTITGAGAGITGIADAFRFAYKQINSTSFTITARVPSSGAITAAGRAGLMVREQLTAGSRHASALYSGTAPAVWFHTRATAGGTTNTSSWTSSDRWVRLTRSGNTFTAFRSSNGTTWTQVGTPMSLAMGSSVYVGLAMTSGQNNLNGTATIDSVAMP